MVHYIVVQELEWNQNIVYDSFESCNTLESDQKEDNEKILNEKQIIEKWYVHNIFTTNPK